MITANDIAVSNATARSGGAVGSDPLVYRVARKLARKLRGRKLDFGAGPRAVHTGKLGPGGVAHDHGRNHVPGVHDPGALGRKYSLVAASNVLNTLPSRSAVQSTINQIAQVTQPGGEAIVNYPGSPRKAGLPDAEVEEMLRKRFRGLQKLQSGVYRCTK